MGSWQTPVFIEFQRRQHAPASVYPFVGFGMGVHSSEQVIDEPRRAVFAETIRTHRNEFVDIVFEMKNLATRDECKKLSDIDETLYEKWQRSYEM